MFATSNLVVVCVHVVVHDYDGTLGTRLPYHYFITVKMTNG